MEIKNKTKFFYILVLIVSFFYIKTNTTQAAAITSAQAGNWSSGSTWTGGVVPGNGDTVTINHAVVGNTTTTVGNSGAPVYGYVKNITGSGGSGYSGCSASISGGTALIAATASCSVVNGAAIVTLTNRGWYTAGTPTLSFSGTGGSGASWTLNYTAGGGTAAILVGTNGSLTFNSNFTIRGDLNYVGEYGNTTNAFTINSGVTVTMDSSVASGTPMYSIGPTANDAYRTLSANCASSRCTLTSTGNISTISSRYLYGPIINFNNILINNFGDSSTAAIAVDTGNSRVSLSITNSKFTNSGRIDSLGYFDADQNFDYSNNEHQNSTGNTTLDVDFENDLTTGTRYIRNNVFDKKVGANDPASSMFARGATITGNYFGDNFNFLTNKLWSSFDSNFVHVTSTSTCNSGYCTNITGSSSNVYYYFDVDSHNNPHFTRITPGNYMQSNWILGFSGSNPGDSGEAFLSEDGSYTQTIKNSIALPSAVGRGSYEFTSMLGSYPNIGYNFQNNVWYGGHTVDPTFGFGMVQINETGNTPAGKLSMKNNIIWATSSTYSFQKIDTINNSTPTSNVCSSGECDYNSGYNHKLTQSSCTGCTNQGNGYAGAWTQTPGQHDVDTDPKFLDYTRNVEVFDREYLGKPLGSTWSSGGTYNYGDIVSNATSIYYGDSINYRCIVLSGCTGALQPGVSGTNWRNYWEWASLYWLRTETVNKTTYNDSSIGCSSCSVTQALQKWVRMGYSTTNILLKGAASDGGDIGAMSFIDLAGPVISSVSSTSTVTTATITWNTDESSDSKVYFGTTTSYGFSSSTLATSTIHSITLTGLSSSTLYHYLVVSKDLSGNTSTSTDYTFTTQTPPDTTPPIISAISAGSISSSGATITWTTNENSSSQVEFGTSLPYTASSSLDSSLVTSHSVSLSGLLPNTTYHFRVLSLDSSNNRASSTDQTFTTTAATSGGGGGGGSAGGPILPIFLPTTSNTTGSSNSTVNDTGKVKLVNNSGTFYLVQGGQLHGITNPGILNSHGFTFSDAKPASSQDLSLPKGSLLTPADGSLVKSKEDPTVYLISSQKRYSFTSAQVFLNLGFKFSSVLIVTNPELQLLPKDSNISNSQSSHLPGTNVLINKTIYRISENKTLQPYPSLEVYNSWNIANDFSGVVNANQADLALPTGEALLKRLSN